MVRSVVSAPNGQHNVEALVARIRSSREIHLTAACGRLLQRLATRRDDVSHDEKVTASRLRDVLDYYFDKTEGGRRETDRLRLPVVRPGSNENYTLQQEANRLRLTRVEHFWDSHCVGRPDREELLVVYTEPLFFWVKSQRCFVRFLDINWESTDTIPDDLLKRAHEHYEREDLVPSFHYKPSGEVAARDSLLRFLRRYNVIKHKQMQVNSLPSRECPHNDSLWSRNLIMLGNRRTNGLLRRLQDDRAEPLEMVLMDEDIACRRKPPCRDTPQLAYALLTRMRNRNPAGVVTMIGANHGRAAEKVAEFVTDEDQLNRFYSECGIDASRVLPETFQILFSVDILDFDNPLKAQVVSSTFKKANSPPRR
jgi:hypothetical protein